MTEDEKLMKRAMDAMLMSSDDISDEMFQAIRDLKKRLAQPEQEPVAWRTKNATPPGGYVIFQQYPQAVADLGGEIEPLYTAPPQRKPLTDEDTVALIKQCRDAFAEELGAWDIEPPIHHVQQGYDNCVNWLAAHGIKGEA